MDHHHRYELEGCDCGAVDFSPQPLVALGEAGVREHDLEIAVRGGGHNVAGTAVCDDGIVIDLSAMRAVRVDPGSGTRLQQVSTRKSSIDGGPPKQITAFDSARIRVRRRARQAACRCARDLDVGSRSD
jgi:FAD binding domain